ncbi:MAG: hypothetical protein PHE20_03160 [Patescibacteria group bacterium]|nr:hypothetical protein [Patescibacteria group bacterium]
MNIISDNTPDLISPIFSHIIEIGVNPYIVFVLLVLVIFSLYFLLFSLLAYRGNFNLLKKDFKKMPLKNKRDWFIFLFVGVLMAFIMFYQMLDSFYSPADIVRYRVSSIDKAVASFGDKMVLFLEKIGILR